MKSKVIGRQYQRKSFLSYLWPSVTDPGLEYPTLVKTGLALLFGFLLLVVLPDNVYSVARFIVNPLAAIWVGMALIKTRCRLRFAFPYYILLLFQVWLVVCMLHAETYITKYAATGEYLWFPLELGVPYLLANVLFGLMPGVLRYVINFFLLISGLSAFMALLQAAHFPPAIHLANMYVFRSIEGWDKVEGVRASGLTSSPNVLVLGLVIAASLIAYKSTQRNLRWMDWTLWSMFIAGGFVAQHRSSMPILAVTFIVTGLIMARKRPHALVFIFGGAATCLVVAMTFGHHLFGYTFDTDWAHSSELESRFSEEQSAYLTYMQNPIFGIGPAPAVEAIARDTDPVYDYKIENLYAAILLISGAPGLALLLTTYVSALVISIATFFRTRLPYGARVMAAAGAIGAFALLFNGNVQVNITQFQVMFIYMVLMAMVQSAVDPRVTVPKRVRVSPYLQPSDRAKAASALASIN